MNEDQSWYWTEEWQAGERQAQRDIDEGNTETFGNIEDLIVWLETETEIGDQLSMEAEWD